MNPRAHRFLVLVLSVCSCGRGADPTADLLQLRINALIRSGRYVANDHPLPGRFLVSVRGRDAELLRSSTETPALLEQAPQLGRDLLEELGITEARRIHVLTASGCTGIVYSGNPIQAVTLLENRALRSRVDRVEEVGTVHAIGAAPPWGVDRLDQCTADIDCKYAPPNAGAGAHIFFFDTGLNEDVQFDSRVGVGFSALGNNTTSDCVSHPHGTRVAGVAASRDFGAAPGAILHPVQVLDCGKDTSMEYLIDGIAWMERYQCKHPGAVRIANMSLIGDFSKCINDAVNAATAHGIVTVAGAGNTDEDACGFSPASAVSAITVGGLSRADSANPSVDALWIGSLGSSNHGKCVHVYAGADKVTTVGFTPQSNCGIYGNFEGTSFSAPLVSALAAMYVAKWSGASALEVRQSVICHSPVVPVTPLKDPVRVASLVDFDLGGTCATTACSPLANPSFVADAIRHPGALTQDRMWLPRCQTHTSWPR